MSEDREELRLYSIETSLTWTEHKARRGGCSDLRHVKSKIRFDFAGSASADLPDLDFIMELSGAPFHDGLQLSHDQLALILQKGVLKHFRKLKKKKKGKLK